MANVLELQYNDEQLPLSSVFGTIIGNSRPPRCSWCGQHLCKIAAAVSSPVLVRVATIEGELAITGFESSLLNSEIHRPEAESLVESALVQVLQCQRLLPNDDDTVVNCHLSDNVVEYSIRFRSNIDTVADVQRSIRLLLSNALTLSEMSRIIQYESSTSSTAAISSSLASVNITQHTQTSAESFLETRHVCGLRDGRQSMSFMRQQREPVFVTFAAELGNIKMAFKSFQSAEKLLGERIDMKSVQFITPIEYLSFAKKNPEMVVAFREMMGVKTSLDQPFDFSMSHCSLFSLLRIL